METKQGHSARCVGLRLEIEDLDRRYIEATRKLQRIDTDIANLQEKIIALDVEMSFMPENSRRSALQKHRNELEIRKLGLFAEQNFTQSIIDQIGGYSLPAARRLYDQEGCQVA